MSATPDAAAARIVFHSRPALVMGSIMSLLLVGGSFAMWFGLGPNIRSQFNLPQIVTLLFFLAVIVVVVMSVGLSSIVCDAAGLHVRNAVRTHHYTWDEVAGAEMGEGDPWAYVLVNPSPNHPDGESQMALAIQRTESASAQHMEELRQVIAGFKAIASR